MEYIINWFEKSAISNYSVIEETILSNAQTKSNKIELFFIILSFIDVDLDFRDIYQLSFALKITRDLTNQEMKIKILNNFNLILVKINIDLNNETDLEEEK